jgi:predicted acylesterase/phospholipase RssA
MEGTRQDEPDWRDPPHESRDPSADAAAPWGDVWPRARQVEGRRLAGLERPTVSFLFSGGVFRGVFQVGVLNGLSEAGLVPDVVAGASVGSITAAMAASAYFGTATLAAPQPLAARQAAIRRLAAAYLAIDRLVLTDRFADFIRGITVRAAQSRFSIRQADRVIRRYDDANSWSWSQEVRSVAAGLERLAYLSPFELVELVEAFRRQNPRRVADLLREDLQEFLNRAGVGAEVLGAEPLALLIREYVLEALARAPDARLDGMRFHEFLERGLVFLATTTNLTDGHLVVLGEEQLLAGGQSIVLPQSLLASSAFPAVFRPRWEWELRPQTGAWRQYIDGGVVDNLPLDAVAQFLSTAARSRLIERRPLVPHLVFSASLETETAKIDADDRELDELLRNWPRLLRRAQRLGYNKKLEMFTRTQRNLRAIMAERRRGGPLEPGRDYVPLDLWVTTVIPKWLCGTFAFHPMLGFRQWKQAASIAHGCASTLLALGYEAALPRGGAARAVAWGMDQSLLPAAAQCTAPDPFARQAEPAERGNCWYRPAVPCPFAAQARDGPRRTAAALAEIYDRCGHAATHRPQ